MGVANLMCSFEGVLGRLVESGDGRLDLVDGTMVFDGITSACEAFRFSLQGIYITGINGERYG